MFRERIKAVYNDLSAGYRVVADFMLDHPLDTALMTASSLAKHLNVDTATVVRFAQRLGYAGYPELLQDVRAIVREEHQRRLGPVEPSAGNVGVFRRSVEAEHRNLDRLLAGLDDDTLEQLVAAIAQARHILIVGQWAMEALGEFFALWLRALGKSAQAVSADVLSAGYALRDLTANDTVVAFALTGLSVEMINTLRAAKTTGARLVAFAPNRSQAAARIADVEIICPGENAQPLASFVSMAAATAALIQALAARDPAQYAQDAEAFDKIYATLLTGYQETAPRRDQAAHAEFN